MSDFRPDFYDLPVCGACGPVEYVQSAPGGHGILVKCACGESKIDLPRRPRISYDGRLCRMVEKARRWRLRRIVAKGFYSSVLDQRKAAAL